MIPLLDTLRYVCASHLLLIALLLLGRYRYSHTARYAAAFCISLIAYLLFPIAARADLPLGVRMIFFMIMSINSFAFWMVALALFRDDFRTRWYHWLVMVLRMAVGLPAAWLVPGHGLSPLTEFLISLPIVVFAVVLVGLGVREAAREFNDDLIETRRRIRVWYLISAGGAIVFVALFRLGITGGHLLEIHNLATASITLVLIYAFFLTGVRLHPDLIAQPDHNVNSQTAAPEIDQGLLQNLIRACEEERVYREEGLTIRALARRLNTHEYRLRQLINAGLGYRNFNAFLNRYRVQEACERLLQNSEEERLPIIRISEELGYRSLASFNKAFRELTGQTPSEYRKQPQIAADKLATGEKIPGEFRNP